MQLNEIPVFQLLFEPRHNVLMTRYYGTYVPDDITLRDRAAQRFVAKRGLARGIIDFSDVEAVEVPVAALVKRAHEPPVLPGQARVIVAPDDVTYGLNRVFAAHQLVTSKVEPLLVRTLGEAFRALALSDPKFEPVESDESAALDDTVFKVLAKIDAARGNGETTAGSADAERQRLRATMLRLLDSLSIGRPGRSLSRPNTITLGDVLNAALGRVRVTDADLRATCERCARPVSLGLCKIVAGRETTYACPACSSVLVVLAPAAAGTPPQPQQGYPLGTFTVWAAVDIECPGARLPKSP